MKRTCLWKGARVASNVRFFTNEGRRLGDAPFNSYGWCKTAGKQNQLQYEGEYEENLFFHRIEDQLIYVTGNDGKDYIAGFRPRKYHASN